MAFALGENLPHQDLVLGVQLAFLVLVVLPVQHQLLDGQPDVAGCQKGLGRCDKRRQYLMRVVACGVEGDAVGFGISSRGWRSDFVDGRGEKEVPYDFIFILGGAEIWEGFTSGMLLPVAALNINTIRFKYAWAALACRGETHNKI